MGPNGIRTVLGLPAIISNAHRMGVTTVSKLVICYSDRELAIQLPEQTYKAQDDEPSVKEVLHSLTRKESR
nr:hypothetical protein KS05_26825 [Rhizobium brockwellii]